MKGIKLKNKKYILAISFANYVIAKSGMPKVMLSHQILFNKAETSYISLFSVKKNIYHDKYTLFCYFGILVDGEFIGVYSINEIIKMLKSLDINGYDLLGIHIHHLLYIKLKHIQRLLDHVLNVPIKIFLHDYYYACTRYNLMYNKEYYCGGKGLNSINCSGCKYYESSIKQEKLIHEIFTTHKERITFISPSDITKDIFLRFHPEYKNQTIVISHQNLIGHNKDNLELIEKNEKIRIAFLGMPARHKGWDAWVKLVNYLPKDKYEFYVFNSSKDEYEGMNKVYIQFDGSHLNSMVDALCKNKIHIAFLWAIWPETYSYTCFESYAANAFIITNEYSGNITDVIKKYNNVMILSDNYCEVLSHYDSLREMINSYRLNNQGGPLLLEDNDEIVQMSFDEEDSYIVDIKETVKMPSMMGKIVDKLYRKRIGGNV